MQLVRNVEDRAAFGCHAAQDDEELLDLLRRQDRGRLVHDQQVRLQKKRADDLDPLPLSDRQRRDDPPWLELQPVVLHHVEDARLKVARGDPRVHPQRDVLQHRHCLEKREVLENHADAEHPGGLGILHDGRGAIPDDLPFIGLHDAVDHLHEGGLAGAVLAEKRMDLARQNRKTDVIVGKDAGKPFGDSDQLKSRHGAGRRHRHALVTGFNPGRSPATNWTAPHETADLLRPTDLCAEACVPTGETRTRSLRRSKSVKCPLKGTVARPNADPALQCTASYSVFDNIKLTKWRASL